MESLKFKRMTNVATTVIFLLCCLPQTGMCSPIPIEQIALDLVPCKQEIFLPSLHINLNPVNSIERSFENLIERIYDSEDPLATTRQFFHAFIEQLNTQNGTSLAMEDACLLLRQNIDLVPQEYREIFLLATSSIESNPPNVFLTQAAVIYWPWEWNWFGLNKKDKKHHQQPLAAITSKVPPKILIFGLIVAGVTLVAIFNPAAIAVTTKALTQAAPVFF